MNHTCVFFPVEAGAHSCATLAHRVALISVSIALSNSLRCESTKLSYTHLLYTACLITTQQMNGQAELTWMVG